MGHEGGGTTTEEAGERIREKLERGEKEEDGDPEETREGETGEEEGK